MTYEDLLIEADSNHLVTKEKKLPASKGRIKGNRIAIRSNMETKEKKCVLAEELGHYYTTVGDIMDQSKPENQKQEYRARVHSYNKLIGLYGIINCYKQGCTDLYDMAEHLDVTEAFLLETLNCYKSKYGTHTRIDNYILYFEPYLSILELK